MPTDSPRLWIAITRPDNLINALAIASAGRDRFSRCCLLYENSSWWEHVDLEECRTWFGEVQPVEKVRTCRGLRDLPRFYRALRARQQRLAELRIAPEDTIVALAGITQLSNALASAYPGVRKILCVTVKKYVDASRSYSLVRYRPTTSGWLQSRFIEPRVGLRRTIHLKPWRGGGDGVRLQRPAEPLEKIYEEIVLLSNDGEEIPAGAGGNVTPARFPSLRDLGGFVTEPAEGWSKPRRVLLFGTPFLAVHNLPPKLYAERLNACLNVLRAYYGASHTLIYRPHPAETTEHAALDLRGFVIENDRQVAELYFLRHFQEIDAVFSVSSTVSRVAFNYGLNGYALWRCFPFNDQAARYFESLMGRVPPEFDVRSPDQPPVRYARSAVAERTGSFLDVIRGVFSPLSCSSSFPPTPHTPAPGADG